MSSADCAQANEKRAETNEQQAVAEKENVHRALAKSALALAGAMRPVPDELLRSAGSEPGAARMGLDSDNGSERTITNLNASGAAKFYHFEITRP